MNLSIYTSFKINSEKQANLKKADLTNADLSNADLTKAKLTNANLKGAKLTNAVLCKANLSDAVVLNAELRGIDFQGATFAYFMDFSKYFFLNMLDLLAWLKIKKVAIRDLKPDNLLVAGDPARFPEFLESASQYSIGLIDVETAVSYETAGEQEIDQPGCHRGF